MKTFTGIVVGSLAGAAVGFLGGAGYLAAAATIRGESFDGMGLLFFGVLGLPVGLILGAALGAVLGPRLTR